MAKIDNRLAAHYGQDDLFESILAGLRKMGKDPANLRPEDLAPVDAFHIRGRAATLELGQLAGIAAGSSVLDVGCGLGGSARHLATTFGCRVTGLDLIPAYVQTAARLTELLGMQAQVTFREGSALEMPFPDGSFDLVWSEHVQMNIADKAALLRQIHRVLKPGGRFVFHEILQGSGGEPYFPAPWASDASQSVLIDPAGYRALLEGAGFAVLTWDDKTEESLEWFSQIVQRVRAKGTPPLGVHLLTSASGQETMDNNLLNLQEGRIMVFQGVAQKPA
ncbi:MAG: methyltransferase domain-containing protein [Candidatus Lambdaproteobacteria bacterium]|nr:methyltransferase domain-containing protein [Candidatus Lambdaproteobacteria bacterium]